MQHSQNHCHDTEEHDDALDEVVHGRGLISTKNHIDGGKDGHDDYTILILNAKSHLKEGGDSFIHTSCVRDEEDEGND